MKKNGWGIVLALGLFVIELAMPERVWAQIVGNDDGCACGMTQAGGCRPCLPTSEYCIHHPVTDPQCNGSGGCEGSYGPDCPAGTKRSDVVDYYLCDDKRYAWCGPGNSQRYATVEEQMAINNSDAKMFTMKNSGTIDGCGWCRYEERCGEFCNARGVCHPVGCYQALTCQTMRSQDMPKIAITYKCTPICGATAPTCSSVGVQSATTTNTTGTFYAYTYGVTAGTTNVKFPTWSAVNGQDDIVWYNGVNMGGGTWRAAIDLAAHSASRGFVNVHVYMDGTASCFVNTPCGSTGFTILDNKIAGTVYYDPKNTCVTSASAGWGKGLGMAVSLDGTAGMAVSGRVYIQRIKNLDKLEHMF